MKAKTVTKEFIYNRESFISSVLADAITFGFLISLMFLNFMYWTGRWYVTVGILITWLLFTSAKASRKIKTFYSLDEIIEYLEAERRKK